MKTYHVSIREVGLNGREFSTTVRADDEYDARNRACVKLFGYGSFWFGNNGLPPGYGQVFRDAKSLGLKGDGNHSQTEAAHIKLTLA